MCTKALDIMFKVIKIDHVQNVRLFVKGYRVVHVQKTKLFVKDCYVEPL